MTDNEIELEIERGLPELERQCRKLSAECERLIDMRHKMAMELSDFVDRKDCVINSQKAEIESFNVELNAMRGAANSYKLENERLLQKLQQAKSEAIKDFAERLKEKLLGMGTNTTYGKFKYGTVKSYEIDNLLKEMEGYM